jgi:valyl-tRNA synthetase
MLARLDGEAVEVAADLNAPQKAATLAAGGMTVFLPLANLIDLEAERKRIQSEIDNVDKQVQRIEGMLGNPGFTSKAPAQVIERERTRLGELQERHAQLMQRMAELAN